MAACVIAVESSDADSLVGMGFVSVFILQLEAIKGEHVAIQTPWISQRFLVK